MNYDGVRTVRSSSDPIRAKIERVQAGGGPRVLDLFSGCGGLSLGFMRAGFEISAGVDIDPEAASSHAVNFHNAEPPRSRQEREQFVRDIAGLEPDALAAEVGANDPAMAFDVLIGGPPCQSYARIGRAKLREVAEHPTAFKVDPRGNLYMRYLDYVRRLAPLVIVMENVPDVLNYGGHNVAEETAEVLDGLGYNCRYTLLNAVFYGVPQMRERMFLIAYHRALNSNVRFPRPTHHWRLPGGYQSARQVALKHLRCDESLFHAHHFRPPPEASSNSSRIAVSAVQAIGDIPPIIGHLKGEIRRGVRRLEKTVPFTSRTLSSFAREMREWPGFFSADDLDSHVIRALPRDYKIFRRMNHGDQYPEAHALANRLFEAFIDRIKGTRREVTPGSPQFELLKADFVPPYDPGKFPNKWRKMSPDEPVRTVMAHLGKDSYSHIHYDSRQARTLSVREAARLQSFPDGFRFIGAMNSAFRQIGNAVPPLLAFRLAETIMADVFVGVVDEARILEDSVAPLEVRV